MPDYTIIDRPDLLPYVFYPRPEVRPLPFYATNMPITVWNDKIVCRAYKGDKAWPWILYFHGNGEVVSDYDEIAPFYFKRKLNLIVADYRGYGESTGEPTFTNLVRDSHTIFHAVRETLSREGFPGDLWIMGRSLGSISALELAYHYKDIIPGIIIESGFISVARIMRQLDVPIDDESYRKIDQECLEMVRNISTPALIIHGEYDTIAPYQEGIDLYENIGSERKEFLTIPAADHNDIMFVGLKQYFEAIVSFINPVREG